MYISFIACTFLICMYVCPNLGKHCRFQGLNTHNTLGFMSARRRFRTYWKLQVDETLALQALRQQHRFCSHSCPFQVEVDGRLSPESRIEYVYTQITNNTDLLLFRRLFGVWIGIRKLFRLPKLLTLPECFSNGIQ